MRWDIDDPCNEDWDSMTPRAGGRFCDRCEHVVMDLTGVTAGRAGRMVRAAERGTVPRKGVCIRIAVDAADAPIFRAEPVAHWASGLLLVAALTAGGCASGSSGDVTKAAIEQELEGPPMTPIDPEAAAPCELVTGPVSPILLADATDDSPAPTAEQQMLTEAKHRPRIRMGRRHSAF